MSVMSVTQSKGRSQGGFTLMEMLVVVAIIAVLVAIAIPVFMSQIEKSREAADLANVRSAYAEVMAAAVADDGNATHGEDKIKQADGSFRAVVSPLAQQQDNWTTNVEGMSIGGVSYAEWKGSPKAGGKCTIQFVPSSNVCSITWGDGFALWSGLNTTVPGNGWWNHSDQRQQAFNKLRETNNEERKASDIEILKSLANYFNGMSAEEAKKILGDKRYSQAISSKDNGMLFEYGQDGGGSIRINSLDTSYQPYFSELGYDAKIYASDKKSEVDSFANGAYNYVNKYLFTSDEMLGSSYKQTNFHNVNIKFNVDGDKVTGTRVWINGLDSQGYTSAGN